MCFGLSITNLCYMDLVSTFLTFYLINSHVYFLSRLVFCQCLHNLYHVDKNHFILPWHQHFSSYTIKQFYIYVDMKYFCYTDLVSTFSYMCVGLSITNLCSKHQLFTVLLITLENIILT